jgi:RNA polymerase sigma-70 factor (ECF subfamily)
VIEPAFESVIPTRGDQQLAFMMGRAMDKPTFDRIVDEHGDYIRRTLRALRVPENDVQDVAQEVLAAVHRGLPAFDPTRAEHPASAERSWLIAICQRQAKNYHRARLRRSKHEYLEGDLDRELAEGLDNEEVYDACETTLILFELVNGLCPERRDVMIAYEVEGMPMSDVAQAQGVALNTAWNRLRLGREDLRTGWRRRVR